MTSSWLNMAQHNALVHQGVILHVSPILWTGIILGEPECGDLGSAEIKVAGSTQPCEHKLEISSEGIFNLKIIF